jgi:hypothetical protein
LDDRHQIEPKQCEVGEIVLCELFVLEMRMNASQTAKAFGRDTRSPEVGHLDLLCIPNHHVLDLSFPVDKHTDLSPGLLRELGHLAGKFLRNYLRGRDAACRETFNASKLIMFEALSKPRDGIDRSAILRGQYSKVVR